MRILFLTHAYNSLTQRLHAELAALGHEVSIEFDIADSVAEEAVALFRPDLIVAPYLRRAIPQSIWSRLVCLVVHPGVIGDRGPSALDWAIADGAGEWGVTVLQANAVMDGGDIWASRTFPLRAARKASVYRRELTEAACAAVQEAVARLPAFRRGEWRPQPLAAVPSPPGRERPLMRQADRRIDWRTDSSARILATINAGDGFPGVADRLFGEDCRLFDAWPETVLSEGLADRAGDLLGRRETALLRATVDGAIWIGQVRRNTGIDGGPPFKLPATEAFADHASELAALPEFVIGNWWREAQPTWQDIAYREAEADGVAIGFLSFEFYNGAMSTRQCERLREAYAWARTRPTRVIVLEGGADFWSNGIHLNTIEADASPSDESWRNINAIDDLAQAIIETGSQLTVAALAGNCGAGGCFLARAADFVWARAGVILNPHYRNMGNLYGSEYWTYLLPPRVGVDGAAAIMRDRRPLTARAAVDCGLIDRSIEGSPADFADEVRRLAFALAGSGHGERLAAKRARRERDEAEKTLATYRAEELAQMRRNFYGFDPSYHVARYHFVNKSPASWTPRHLARHRELGWRIPE